MPRQPRILPQQGFLHVMCRGNNRRKLFRTPTDKRKYRSLLIEFKQEDKIQIHHYCLMGNHHHLMLSLGQESNLPWFMKRVNLQYFFYYRYHRSYSGHLWQGRYKSKLILNYPYLLQCGKYIELNPVSVGLTVSPKDYEFSSYRFYAFGQKDDLIDINPYYLELNTDQAARQLNYQDLFVDEIAEKNIKI